MYGHEGLIIFKSVVDEETGERVVRPYFSPDSSPEGIVVQFEDIEEAENDE